MLSPVIALVGSVLAISGSAAARSSPHRVHTTRDTCDLGDAHLLNTPVQLQYYFSSTDPDHTYLTNAGSAVSAVDSSALGAYNVWYINRGTTAGKQGFFKINNWDGGKKVESCLTADYNWYNVEGTTCQASTASNDNLFFQVSCGACNLPGGKAAQCQIKSFINNRCLTVGADGTLHQQDCQDGNNQQLFGINPSGAAPVTSPTPTPTSSPSPTSSPTCGTVPTQLVAKDVRLQYYFAKTNPDNTYLTVSDVHRSGNTYVFSNITTQVGQVYDNALTIIPQYSYGDGLYTVQKLSTDSKGGACFTAANGRKDIYGTESFASSNAAPVRFTDGQLFYISCQVCNVGGKNEGKAANCSLKNKLTGLCATVDSKGRLQQQACVAGSHAQLFGINP